jgi:hypothetical protein
MEKEKKYPFYIIGAISGASFSACAFVYTFNLTNESAGLIMCICIPMCFCSTIISFNTTPLINNSICTIIGGLVVWLIGSIIINQWLSFTLVTIFFIVFITIIFKRKIKPLFFAYQNK